MFKESMRLELERMIYEKRRASKGERPDMDLSLLCPFDQCCQICRKLFPEFAEEFDDSVGKMGCHPCDYYGDEYVLKRVKEVILNGES